MLPKQNRLKKEKEFQQVLKKGRGLKEGFLLLKFVNNNLDRSRFGIIISQKVSKKATIRNKIKRKIKAAICLNMPRIRKGLDVILITKPGLETRDFWEIKEAIDNLFKKAKIIN